MAKLPPITPLQKEILLLMLKSAHFYTAFEDRCDLGTPKQLRRELGELIVNGYVEQRRTHHGLVTYALMPPRGTSLAMLLNPRPTHAQEGTTP